MGHLENLQKYADLVVKIGINTQDSQEVVITTPIEGADFARMLAQSAYDAGAKEVIIHYNDEKFARMKIDCSPLEVFEKMPEWEAESRNYYAKRKAAFISIAATDPDIFAGADSKKLDARNKAKFIGIKPMYDMMDKNELQWNVISIPTLNWAKRVFPNVSDEKAIENLWEAIFKATRIDTKDPVEAWDIHNKTLTNKAGFLNEKQFKEYRFKSENGTDVTVGMTENHIFEGGSCETRDGVTFFPNMPTEEVFSMPHRDRINGTIVSSMPLNYQGSLIEGFSLTLKDGKIIDYKADKGYDGLQRLIETDEGSHYLGEIALVPYNSPISNMDILFYNTLFDENASCHFAIGSAYPTTIKGGEFMSKEELLALGGNDSLEHIDFMVGTKDLSIIGITKNGEEIPVFVNGNWA